MEPGASAGHDLADRLLDAYRAGLRPLVLVLQRQSQHGAVRGLRAGPVGPDAGPVAVADTLDRSGAAVPYALPVHGAVDRKSRAAACFRGLGIAQSAVRGHAHEEGDAQRRTADLCLAVLPGVRGG